MIQKYALYLAWIVSIAATGGSLYFSEVMLFAPCELCWYQRILMYPLVIWLGIATFRSDRNASRYILPISILGMILSGYHYSLQKIPGFHAFNACEIGVSCSGEYINALGFITIPFLSFTAFSLITLFLILFLKNKKRAV